MIIWGGGSAASMVVVGWLAVHVTEHKEHRKCNLQFVCLQDGSNDRLSDIESTSKGMHALGRGHIHECVLLQIQDADDQNGVFLSIRPQN